MTLKLRILRSLTRLFIILLSLTRSLLSGKMLISNRCIIGLMSNLIKKSWTVSRQEHMKEKARGLSTFCAMLEYKVLPITKFYPHKFVEILFHWLKWLDRHYQLTPKQNCPKTMKLFLRSFFWATTSYTYPIWNFLNSSLFRLFPIISISQKFFSIFFLTLRKNRNRRKRNLLL